jgi:hypothetical protein
LQNSEFQEPVHWAGSFFYAAKTTLYAETVYPLRILSHIRHLLPEQEKQSSLRIEEQATK